jgi:hypothetical protein
VQVSTIVVGSLLALKEVATSGELVRLASGADVVVVPTAAAFTGITEAAIELSSVFDDHDVNVEALMIAQRADCSEPFFAQRISQANLVVISDGSALHAMSVWRATPVGEAIRDATRLIAVGACASVLGEVMIDPRGGAPTTGLGYREGLAIGVQASDEQLSRTRALLGDEVTLAVLGPRGVVYFDGTKWSTASDDVVVTRGETVVAL